MPKEDELGCLWIKTGGKNGEYMTGKIGDTPVVAFKNTSKKNPKEPDWRILKSKPKEERAAPSAPAQDFDDANAPF